MLVPLSWLKQYVPVDLAPKELAHRLTMAGTEIGAVREIGAEWDRDKVLVGLVLGVEPHPNADRLTLPTVDLGNGETATVVCGAPNVAAGQKIAFAREGARIVSYKSGQLEELKSAKIRGVLSTGMVCSELELGLGENHEGVLVLDAAAPVGRPLADYLGDAVFDAEVTPNRPDCLSILGVAHEVAALTGLPLTEPDLSYPEEGAPIEEAARFEIADSALCYRYSASLITGVRVGESPGWLKDALTRAGQRPINGIVDITNYVMLEYGQPLHAFDFDNVKDGTVIIRRARDGEKLAALDGETYKLRPPMLVIADSQDAIALAGVVGGEPTGVTKGTTSILLESANFSPSNTRRTVSTLRLSTEASYRFERAISAELTVRALKRATQLVLQIAGGKAAKGHIDLYPGRQTEAPITLTRNRIVQVLGVDYDMDRAEEVLTSLGFECSSSPGCGKNERSNMRVTPPYWRIDVSIEDDLVEEVARVVGYDSIPTTMLSAPVPHHEPQPKRELREKGKDILVASGMQEVISYPLTDLDTLVALQPPDIDQEPLKIANPLSSEMSYLRTTLRGSVLDALSTNRRVSRDEGMRLFEVGHVFIPRQKANDRDLPDEKEVLVGVLSGPRFQVSWMAPQGEMDFFDAKGVVTYLLEQLGVAAEYESAVDRLMHPGKAAAIVHEGRHLGVIGEVHPQALERFDLDECTVAMFEIDLDALYEKVTAIATSYTAASRFPESSRDLALVVDASVSSAQLLSIISRHQLVKDASPFDLYAGEGIPAGKKSIAFRVVYQSARSTLTAELVDRAQGDIVRQLQREIGAELRH